jgi:hypothetical protein
MRAMRNLRIEANLRNRDEQERNILSRDLETEVTNSQILSKKIKTQKRTIDQATLKIR